MSWGTFRRRAWPRLVLFSVWTTGCAMGCGPDEQKFELSVSDNNPSGTPIAKVLDDWAVEVIEKSSGQLQATVYHDGQLLTGHEDYEGVQTGAADVVLYVLDGADGFILNTIAALPFMGWPDQLGTREIYLELLEDYPEMVSEWKATIIGTWMMPGTHLHNVKQDVRLPEDLLGMRVVGAEKMTSEVARAVGAIPVELDMSDLHRVLENGTVDAIINHFPTLVVFNVLDLLKYHTIFQSGINMTPQFLLINSDVYGNLPSELQTVLNEAGDFFRDQMSALDAAMSAAVDEELANGGHSVQRLTEEEVTVWYEIAKRPIHDEWIASGEAKGLPAQALYDDTLARIQAATLSQ